MQGVIQRMAENSRSCKVWCITLVSAILVLIAQTGEPWHTLIALVPAALFVVLDIYYLALERGFRCSYNTFVCKLHRGKLISSNLYTVAPTGAIPKQFLASLGSFSIWPFYLTLAVLIALVALVRWFVIP